MRILLIFLGILFIALAIVGIILPGFPATPFLLLAFFAFVKSSPRLYNWLISHRIFGPILRDYNEKRGISMKIKIISILMVWITISISIIFFIEVNLYKWIVAACGLLGTSIILLIKTVK